MTIETLLADALHARTDQVLPDPDARARIAAQIAVVEAPTNRRRRVALLATAAAVVAVAGLGSGLVAWSDSHDGSVQTGGSAVAGAPGYPVPPSTYFLAQAPTPGSADPVADRGGVTNDVVRASDGDVVASLPPVDGAAIVDPVLAPDGRRAYGIWGPKDGTLGYLDLVTGRRTVLVHRSGELDSPTVSADGTTLAYEWTPALDGNDVSSVVIRDLASGSERVLNHAPAGPVALALALSPDGSRLALVPRDRGVSRLPLWVVPTAGADAFAHPTVLAFGSATCSADEPRWGNQGLFALRECTGRDGVVAAVAIARVDVADRSLHVLHPPTVNHFPQLTVLDRETGPLFVVADVAIVGQETVTAFDPDNGWQATVLPGLIGLPG